MLISDRLSRRRRACPAWPFTPPQDGEITMPTKAQLPVLAAKLAANVARERVAPVRATSLDDVPPSASALTTDWLTAALCRDTPDAAVTGYEVVGGSDG